MRTPLFPRRTSSSIPGRARSWPRGLVQGLERVLLYICLLLLFPAVASDVVRVPYDVSFASDALWSAAARPGRSDPGTAWPSAAPSPTLVPTSALTATPAGLPGRWHVVAPGDVLEAVAARYDVSEQAIMEANGLTDPGLIRVDEPLWIPIDGAPRPAEGTPTADNAELAGGSSTDVDTPSPETLTPTPGLTATAVPPAPTATPVPRYLRGGIAFDAHEPLTLAYPISFESDEWVRFSDLEVLMADQWGESYRRFITEYDHQLYAYPEMVAGTFVLSIHDGTLTSGRELEAEPLRQLIEGPLHNPYDLETIEANLTRLLGSEIVFAGADVETRFRVVQARRMSANDVAEYQYRATELSRFMAPIESPDESFLVLICSGRQPDEPQRPFPGRYVLVVQEEFLGAQDDDSLQPAAD